MRRKPSRTRSSHWRTIALGLALGLATSAQANDDLGLFELDANPSNGDGAGDDWSPDPKAQGSARGFTGIVEDAAPKSIFTGGRKDIQDVFEWSHKDGSVPDKDDLTNAYAAAYDDDGELIFYFGADRFANAGDAFVGFWFFAGEVTANGDGSFGGQHTTDDTLVLVNYLQGANAGPEIKVIKWDPDCSKAASNNPQEGQCAAQNLRLVRSVENALCSGGGDDVCAVTNSAAMPSPWAYVPKDGTSGEFPPESFYEGGINLSQLVGPVCFTSFMAESRSSSSFTASLKDFVLHNIEVCGLGLSKQCTSGNIDASETGFDYTYDGTVTNTGFGMLYDVVVVDDMGTPDNPDDDRTHLVGDLAAGASGNFGGTFWHTDNPATNRAVARAAVQSGGEQRIVSGQAVATCPQVDRDPRISVSKSCKSELVAQDGKVVVQIGFEGQVCNDTGTDAYPAISLRNVVVTDDAGTPGDASDDQSFSIGGLAAQECASYSGTYQPRSVNSTDTGEATFSDTVTATGSAVLGFGDAQDSATANCDLCR